MVINLYNKAITVCITCLLQIFATAIGGHHSKDPQYKTTPYIIVGEAGNPNDPLTGRGRVDHVFEIMATEVPNWLYCDFLNAVTRRSDPFNLYSPLMEKHFFGGILRSQENGLNLYTCKASYEQLPVVFVSWFDAARFVNWLHYGMPHDVQCGTGTTEGTNSLGAYDTRDFPNPVRSAGSAKSHNPGAHFWLPSEDEWLKAGFYGGKGKWWRYATGSDEPPVARAPSPDAVNAANYYSDGWAAPFPHITPVGLYPAKSSFGTFDQAGNVAEWVEALVSDEDGFRKALGGSLFRSLNSLKPSFYEGDRPDKKLSTFGFRVARLTDTSSITLGKNMGQEKSSKLINVIPEALTSVKDSDYVRVGDPGNPPDVFYGNHGEVDYIFEIERYKISNQDYVDFLNAVAIKDDPWGLFNRDMMAGVLGGIILIEKDGHRKYLAKPGWARRPVNYISWYDLARYANWHHYGKKNTGKSEIGTTEGTATEGAYDTSLFEDVKRGKKQPWSAFGCRNKGARYWIPNEDEWYKAAYYDPEKIGSRKYWDFPVRTDNLPDNLPPPGNIHSVNYQKGDSLAVGPPFYLAEVDEYPVANSYFGTQQQGGNVWEWLECWQYGRVGVRGLRGGSFGYTEIGPHACNCDPGGLAEETYVFGGRLARAVDKAGWQAVSPKFSVKMQRRLQSFGIVRWIEVSATLGAVGCVIGFAIGLIIFRALAARKRVA